MWIIVDKEDEAFIRELIPGLPAAGKPVGPGFDEQPLDSPIEFRGVPYREDNLAKLEPYFGRVIWGPEEAEEPAIKNRR